MHKTGGVTFRAGDVVVPLYDDTGALVNLQLINADGLKRTLKGGQVKGACHIIEGKNRPENACGLRRAMRPHSPCIT
jgi:putative DNA primase/helicase